MGENPSYQPYAAKELLLYCSSQPRRCVVGSTQDNLGTDVSQRRHSLRLRDALLRLTHMKLRRLQRIIAREVIVIRQVLGRQMIPLQVRKPPEQRPNHHVQLTVRQVHADARPAPLAEGDERPL